MDGDQKELQQLAERMTEDQLGRWQMLGEVLVGLDEGQQQELLKRVGDMLDSKTGGKQAATARFSAIPQLRHAYGVAASALPGSPEYEAGLKRFLGK